MTKPFDPTKPVQTRDGREAVIYAIYDENQSSKFGSIHGAIKTENHWDSFYWMNNGRTLDNEEKSTDLINIPAKIKFEFWVNLYRSGKVGGHCWTDQETAEDYTVIHKSITKKFEIEVDESEFESQDAVPKIPESKKIVRWVNVYREYGNNYYLGALFDSEAESVSAAVTINRKCKQIKIEFDEF